MTGYRRHHEHQPKRNDTESENAEAKDLEDRAKIARDTFLAAFRGLDGLTEKLLTLPEDQARKALQNAIVALYSKIGASKEARKETFTNMDQCSARLMELTSDSTDSSKLVQWPLIQKIR